MIWPLQNQPSFVFKHPCCSCGYTVWEYLDWSDPVTPPTASPTLSSGWLGPDVGSLRIDRSWRGWQDAADPINIDISPARDWVFTYGAQPGLVDPGYFGTWNAGWLPFNVNHGVWELVGDPTMLATAFGIKADGTLWGVGQPCIGTGALASRITNEDFTFSWNLASVFTPPLAGLTQLGVAILWKKISIISPEASGLGDVRLFVGLTGGGGIYYWGFIAYGVDAGIVAQCLGMTSLGVSGAVDINGHLFLTSSGQLYALAFNNDSGFISSSHQDGVALVSLAGAETGYAIAADSTIAAVYQTAIADGDSHYKWKAESIGSTTGWVSVFGFGAGGTSASALAVRTDGSLWHIAYAIAESVRTELDGEIVYTRIGTGVGWATPHLRLEGYVG